MEQNKWLLYVDDKEPVQVSLLEARKAIKEGHGKFRWDGYTCHVYITKDETND